MGSGLIERIDAHHHLWHYSSEEFAWISPAMEALKRDFLAAELVGEMRAVGVAGCVAVQARQSLEETRWLLECSAECAAIRGVVGWVPLVDPEVRGILREFVAGGRLKGVRHIVQDEPDDAFILREDFGRGVAALLDVGLVYDLLVHERHLPQTVEFVRRHPQQAFVLDHLGKPRVGDGEIAGWREQILRLAEYENVSCKLSGLVTEADWVNWTLDDLQPYLDVALEAFGAERLMAGSDWPVCLLASGYERWWATLEAWTEPLTVAQREQIFGGTAQRIYRL